MPTESDGRLPPHNADAERAVLGSVLRDNRAFDEALLLLGERHFYFDAHQRVFGAMAAMRERGEPIDLVTLSDAMHKAGQIEQIGGYSYISELWDGAPTAANVAYYAKIVHGHAVRRDLIGAGTGILRLAYSPEGDTPEILSKAEGLVFAIAEGGETGQAVDVGACLRSAFDAIDDRYASNRQGVPIGYLDLDKILSGFHRTELTVIAARPSVGKTSLAVNLARNLTKEGHAVLLASLEQNKAELGERLLCCEAEVDSHRVRSMTASKEELGRIHAAGGALRDLHLFIDDAPGQTVSRIAANARRLKRKHGLAVVIVDYLQLIHCDQKKQNREQEVATVSRRLKWMAKELDVVVITLSQLNRGPEDRTDKRPRLSDLRESGAIEQDADNVWLLWKGNDSGSVIGVDVAKQRNGPIGGTGLTFLRHCMRFENHAGRFPWELGTI